MRTLCSCVVFFFFKQKTAYEMRISDWSSDVCSSDLHHTDRDHRDIATLALHRSLAERHDMIAIGHFSLLAAAAGGQQEEDRIILADASLHQTLGVGWRAGDHDLDAAKVHDAWTIGRASCREGVCQYG